MAHLMMIFSAALAMCWLTGIDALTANGQPCTGNAKCTSGLCVNSICACKSCTGCAGSCPAGQQCINAIPTQADFCVPAVLKSPGAACTANSQCLSGSCVAGKCACKTCTLSAICPGGCPGTYTAAGAFTAATCVDSPTQADFCVSTQLKPIGSPCTSNTQCRGGRCSSSGLCECSSCALSSTCPGGCPSGAQTCVVSGVADFCATTALKTPGAACTANSQCRSGKCISGKCECQNCLLSSTCPGGCATSAQTCAVSDSTDFCLSSTLRLPNQPCSANTQCRSGSCVAGKCECSFCPIRSGCPGGCPNNVDTCVASDVADFCAPKATFLPGTACTADSQCRSNSCFLGFCQCSRFCSPRSIDCPGACGPGRTCVFSSSSADYCQDVGLVDNGSSCSLNAQCKSGSCIGGICECTVGCTLSGTCQGGCAGGQECINAPTSANFCLTPGLLNNGDTCTTASECKSGLCFQSKCECSTCGTLSSGCPGGCSSSAEVCPFNNFAPNFCIKASLKANGVSCSLASECRSNSCFQGVCECFSCTFSPACPGGCPSGTCQVSATTPNVCV